MTWRLYILCMLHKKSLWKKKTGHYYYKKWVTGAFLLYLINNVYWLCNRRMQRTKLM